MTRGYNMAGNHDIVPGSPEDIKLTLENLQQFFSNKLKAIDMHARGETVLATSNTHSICHVDGTTDPD